MADIRVEQPFPCLRGADECSGQMQPDEDDGCQFWACDECGFTSAYQLTPQDAGACSMGVPEQLQDRRAPVFIELGRRP